MQTKSRKDCNIEIAEHLRNHPVEEVRMIADEFHKLSVELPQQRAGQIICNYICGDYRENQVCDATPKILEATFPGNPDPFFEESYVTLKRLQKNG